MPVNVVKTKEDEKKWQKAKALAKEQGKKNNFAYIMGVYKKMKPSHDFEKKANVGRLRRLLDKSRKLEDISDAFKRFDKLIVPRVGLSTTEKGAVNYLNSNIWQKDKRLMVNHLNRIINNTNIDKSSKDIARDLVDHINNPMYFRERFYIKSGGIEKAVKEGFGMKFSDKDVLLSQAGDNVQNLIANLGLQNRQLLEPIRRAEAVTGAKIMSRPSLKQIKNISTKRPGETEAEYTRRLLRGETFLADQGTDLASNKLRQDRILRSMETSTTLQEAQNVYKKLLNRQINGVLPKPKGSNNPNLPSLEEQKQIKKALTVDRSTTSPQGVQIVNPDKLTEYEKKFYDIAITEIAKQDPKLAKVLAPNYNPKRIDRLSTLDSNLTLSNLSGRTITFGPLENPAQRDSAKRSVLRELGKALEIDDKQFRQKGPLSGPGLRSNAEVYGHLKDVMQKSNRYKKLSNERDVAKNRVERINSIIKDMQPGSPERNALIERRQNILRKMRVQGKELSSLDKTLQDVEGLVPYGRKLRLSGTKAERELFRNLPDGGGLVDPIERLRMLAQTGQSTTTFSPIAKSEGVFNLPQQFQRQSRGSYDNRKVPETFDTQDPFSPRRPNILRRSLRKDEKRVRDRLDAADPASVRDEIYRNQAEPRQNPDRLFPETVQSRFSRELTGKPTKIDKKSGKEIFKGEPKTDFGKRMATRSYSVRNQGITTPRDPLATAVDKLLRGGDSPSAAVAKGVRDIGPDGLPRQADFLDEMITYTDPSREEQLKRLRAGEEGYLTNIRDSSLDAINKKDRAASKKSLDAIRELAQEDAARMEASILQSNRAAYPLDSNPRSIQRDRSRFSPPRESSRQRDVLRATTQERRAGGALSSQEPRDVSARVMDKSIENPMPVDLLEAYSQINPQYRRMRPTAARERARGILENEQEYLDTLDATLLKKIEDADKKLEKNVGKINRSFNEDKISGTERDSRILKAQEEAADDVRTANLEYNKKILFASKEYAATPEAALDRATRELGGERRLRESSGLSPGVQLLGDTPSVGATDLMMSNVFGERSSGLLNRASKRGIDNFQNKNVAFGMKRSQTPLQDVEASSRRLPISEENPFSPDPRRYSLEQGELPIKRTITGVAPEISGEQALMNQRTEALATFRNDMNALQRQQNMQQAIDNTVSATENFMSSIFGGKKDAPQLASPTSSAAKIKQPKPPKA